MRELRKKSEKNYSMTGKKGPSLFLSSISDHVQIWHAQRKQSELGSILMNFLIILNIFLIRLENHTKIREKFVCLFVRVFL